MPKVKEMPVNASKHCLMEEHSKVGQLAGHEVDAFVSGIGILNGHPVAIGCEDFTVKEGP